MKILLIEDRSERKRLFLESKEIDFNIFPFLSIYEGEDYKALKINVQNDNLDSMINYNLIMSHKSAFSLNEQDIIVNFCQIHQKSLVFFSGGITSSFYDESKIPILHINSKEFYSKTLFSFLNNINEFGQIELLILQFGEKWKLNLMLNAREKLAQLIYKSIGHQDYFEPEDFQKLFSQKVISTFNCLELNEKIAQLCDNGVKVNGIETLEILKQKIDIIIKNEIGVSL